MTRIAVVGGFVIGLLLVALALIVLFAPTPYLGMSAASLERSVGHVGEGGCRPVRGGWICARNEGGGQVRYRVSADWAGCWTGMPVGAVAGEAQAGKISGCVSIMDHLTAR